jgi:DNA-3-methyladenine glycosylase
VETEAYHECEAACHAHVGLTARTHVLFGPPGLAYVYRSYGIHALLNAVCEPEGTGAAVLIRALEPVEGIPSMRSRRGLEDERALCSGPGKLTQALGIGLDSNGSRLTGGPIEVLPREQEAPARPPIVDVRIGITKAADIPWRFCDGTSSCVSKPWPAAMPRRRSRARSRAGA